MSKKKLAGIIVTCTVVAIVVIVLFIVKPWEGAPAAETYTLTTSVSPPEAGSVSPSGGEYESGVQVTLTATPASGYTFNYWDGSASGSSNTVTITMYSNQTINAHFKIAEPGLTPTPCQERAGTFEFEDGTILHASHIGFIDFPHLQGQDYDVPPVSAGYYPYVTLETDIHKYWIREDWLWVYGFVTDGENLIPSCSTSTNCPMGRPAFSLEFLTDDGLQYSGSLDDVVSFSPDCPPLSPANKYTCETEIGGLRATWVSWEGESHELPVMAIEFVEWHYAGPGFSWITPRYGWHQYDTIQAVASGSGTNTSSQYEFNHLSGVEFSRQYDASREAVFTMSDGGKLEVNIIPRGTWSEIKSEGLLFSFYSSHLPLGRFDERYRGILLYVPFEKVKSVHWESF